MKRSLGEQSVENGDRQDDRTAQSDMPAEELMHRYSLGDQQSFDRLYAFFAPKVFGFLRNQLPPDQAAEAFQETFLRLHRYRSRYDRQGPFAPWLFAICRSAAADSRRKYMRLNASSGGRDGEMPAQEVEGADREALTEAVAELAPRDAEAISLRFGSDFEFEEVARRLGTSEVNARKIVSRAVARLRKLLGSRR